MAYLLMNERKNFAKTIKENLNSDINEHDIVNILTTIQSLGFYIIPKCKYRKDGICINADSENLADYCPIKEYEKEYEKRIENSFDFGRKTNQQYFQNYKLPEERTKTAKEIFDYIVKSGIIEIAPISIKAFFKRNYNIEGAKDDNI